MHVQAYTYASPPRSLAAKHDAAEHGESDGGGAVRDGDDVDSTTASPPAPFSFGDDLESALEALRHETRGTPLPHQKLVTVAQLQRRAVSLSDPQRVYPDPTDPRSDEDFFCDLRYPFVLAFVFPVKTAMFSLVKLQNKYMNRPLNRRIATLHKWHSENSNTNHPLN